MRDDRKLTVELDNKQARDVAWPGPARFQQIVWNLMTYAIKFSHEGGLVLVTLERADNRLIF